MTSSRLPGLVGVEPAAGEAQPIGEFLPVLALRLGAELGEDIVHVAAEVLVGDVATAVADQDELAGQQLLQEERVERGDDHPLGQVTGSTEQDDDDRGAGRGQR